MALWIDEMTAFDPKWSLLCAVVKRVKVHWLGKIEVDAYGSATALACRMPEPAGLGYGRLYFGEM